MLKLSKINITYGQRDIIKDSGLIIDKGKITAITGDSGSGKTTLLYAIGLISSNDNYEYELNGKKIKLKSDTVKSKIRKNQIGYVFQDNNLYEDLSVYDNLILAASLVNKCVDANRIKEMLAYVHLDGIGEDMQVSNLSGGEKQRLAIACVLMKEPELIVADEPTSSLDRKNADVIMDILTSIAHDNNCMVVVATHSSNVYDRADVVYKIENKIIQLIRTESNKGNIKKDKVVESKKGSEQGLKHTSNNSFYSTYVKMKNKNSGVLKKIMLLLGAIAIAMVACMFDFGEGFIKQQKENMNRISNQEIYVANVTVPSDNKINFEENLIIKSDVIENIKRNANIGKVYYFYEFKSTGFDFENENRVSESKIVVNGDKEYSFNIENSPNIGMQQYTIMPYYPEQNMDKRVNIEFVENNKLENSVYISDAMAKALDIDKGMEKVDLNIHIRVPVFCYNTIMTNHVDGKKTQYDIDIDMTKEYSDNISISGVLDNNVKNMYSDSGEYIIYMPYEMMEEIRMSYQKDIDYAGELFSYNWNPSAIMTYAKDYSVIDDCIEDIEKLDTNFICINQYQDIEAINGNIASIRNTMLVISIIFFIVVVLLMATVYVNGVVNRKYEFAVLKANGLRRGELNKLLLIESGKMVMWSIALSLILSYIIGKLTNVLISEGLMVITYSTILKIVVISIVAISIPTLLGVAKIGKYSTEKLMRN